MMISIFPFSPPNLFWGYMQASHFHNLPPKHLIDNYVGTQTGLRKLW